MHIELLAITPNAPQVIERAGRTSYLSFDRMTLQPIYYVEFPEGRKQIYAEHYNLPPDLNINEEVEVSPFGKGRILKKWKNSAEKFIEMLIKNGHLSVLEHACATFLIKGGSRAFTHQLVRHRMASFTQQSQRYVDESDFRYVTPPSIEEDPEALKIFEDFMEEARRTYALLKEKGIRKEDARFVLPNAVESEIVITANFREWRHIFTLRGDRAAQWEIRKIVIEIFKILKELVPEILIDMDLSEDGEYIVVRNLKEVPEKK